jgi:hypothetical protein
MATPAFLMETFKIQISSEPPQLAVWYGKHDNTSESCSLPCDLTGPAEKQITTLPTLSHSALQLVSTQASCKKEQSRIYI